MVGHTGIYNAIAKAVHAVDNCVKDVIEAAKMCIRDRYMGPKVLSLFSLI